MRPVRALTVAVLTVAVLFAAALPAAAAQPKQAPAAAHHYRFGASINGPSDVARLSSLMGHRLTSARVFFPGRTPARWSDSATLRAVPANGTVVVSFKKGTPAQVRKFLAGHPRGQACYAAYWHEPGDDFTTARQQANYRAAWRRYAPAIRKAGCKPTLILMAWTLNPASHRHWRDFYAPSAVDVFGFDTYNSAARKHAYIAPATLLARIVAVSRQTHRPWGLAEVGSYRFGSPAARARWAHSLAVMAARHGARFGEWWDSSSRRNGHSYRLDRATARSWHS